MKVLPLSRMPSVSAGIARTYARTRPVDLVGPVVRKAPSGIDSIASSPFAWLALALVVLVLLPGGAS